MVDCTGCAGNCCEEFCLHGKQRYISKQATVRGMHADELTGVSAWWLRQLRLVSTEDGVRTYRCMAHDPKTGRCQVYDKRPEVCRIYDCETDDCLHQWTALS